MLSNLNHSPAKGKDFLGTRLGKVIAALATET
jgi:hypothetical protein